MKVTKASLGIGELHFSNSPARRHTKKQLRKAAHMFAERCCQTNEPEHQYSYDSLTLRDHQRTPLGESGVTV